ncbi:MAG: hypothetical protein HYV29_03730 [Ignavibacteriales bacterium]|nr:hypothetical protein [Ignavibacteriales bacterium]
MKKSISVCLTAFTLLIIGCADKPNPIGDSLNEKGVTFLETTVIAYSDTTYKTPIVNGFSASNLVGKLPTGEEFITLLDFYPTSIADSLKGAKIDTAEIRLTVNYRMLPASPPITLTVFEVLRAFAEGTFSSDTLQSSDIGSVSFGTFSDSMNYSQRVVARIDTNVARRWADDYLDTSKPDFHGFAVKMLANSGVIGFTPFNVFSSVVPSLVIKYTKNGKLDSLSFSSGQDTYVGTYAAAPTLSDLEVRGGVGVRSKLKFDVKFLTGKPMVARSILSMTVDTTLSVYSGYTQDSLVAVLALPGSNIDTSNSTFFSYGVKKLNTGSSPVYEFQVTEIAQRWINSLSANEGVTIRWLAENSSSERIVFYSTAAPDSLKPKLKILYSERNQ